MLVYETKPVPPPWDRRGAQPARTSPPSQGLFGRGQRHAMPGARDVREARGERQPIEDGRDLWIAVVNSAQSGHGLHGLAPEGGLVAIEALEAATVEMSQP